MSSEQSQENQNTMSLEKMQDIMNVVHEQKTRPKKAPRKKTPRVSFNYKSVDPEKDEKWRIADWIYKSDTLRETEDAAKKINDRTEVCQVILQHITGKTSHFQLMMRVKGEDGEELRPLNLNQTKQYLKLYTLADGTELNEKMVYLWKNRLPVEDSAFFDSHPKVGILGDTNVVKLEKFKKKNITVNILADMKSPKFNPEKHKVASPLPWNAVEQKSAKKAAKAVKTVTKEEIEEDHLKSAEPSKKEKSSHDRDHMRGLANAQNVPVEKIVADLESADLKIVTQQTKDEGHELSGGEVAEKKRPPPDSQPAKRVKTEGIKNVIAEKWLTVYDRANSTGKLLERINTELYALLSKKTDLNTLLERDEVKNCVLPVFFCMRYHDEQEDLPDRADLQCDALQRIADFVTEGRPNEAVWREKVWPKLRDAYNTNSVDIDNIEGTALQCFVSLFKTLHNSPFTAGVGDLFCNDDVQVKYWMDTMTESAQELEKKQQMKHTNTILTAIHLWKTKGAPLEAEEDDLFADF